MDGHPKYVVEKYLQFMYEGDGGSAAPAERDGQAPRDLAAAGFTPVGAELRQFGDRRVTIEAVRLLSRGGRSVVFAGQACEIGVALRAHSDIPDPIAGFVVKDRLGREIVGDNTDLMGKKLPPLAAGRRYVVTFQVDAWPNFREGEYSLTVALADGALDDHRQCHYLHDAVIFQNVPLRMPGGILSVLGTRVGFFPEGD
jgi:lipopolysaccharide transport system ATP-binding protein